MPLRQAVRYVVVGASVAGGYLIVSMWLHVRTGLSVHKANLAAIILMHPLSFLGHRHLTFEYAGPLGVAVRRFALLATMSTAVSVAVTAAQAALQLAPVLVLPLNCLIVPVLTFLVLKLWVFAHSPLDEAGRT